jgi:hypothetical protein
MIGPLFRTAGHAVRRWPELTVTPCCVCRSPLAGAGRHSMLCAAPLAGAGRHSMLCAYGGGHGGHAGGVGHPPPSPRAGRPLGIAAVNTHTAADRIFTRFAPKKKFPEKKFPLGKKIPSTSI